MYKLILIIFASLSFLANGESLHKIQLGGDKDKSSFVFEGVLVNKKDVVSIQIDVNNVYAQAIKEIIEANISADKNKILDVWQYKDRSKISSSMNNKKQFDSNIAFFKNILETKLIAVIQHRDHYIVYVEHKIKGINSYLKSYPLVKDNNSFLLSNDLSDDYFFSKLADEIINTYWNH